MKALYIGQGEEGSTSKMRYEVLSSILGNEIELINISDTISKTPRIFRSIGWRYKVGPLIWEISRQIIEKMSIEQKYDLIWVDKGVFISNEAIKLLREKTSKLIHFTPDPAFYYHRSKLFFKNISLYDYCITTKSYELELYKNSGAKNVIYATQGYDERVHKSLVKFKDKKNEVCFIGHFELERGKIIQDLIDSNIQVVLAGIKWEKFVKKNKDNLNLLYLGKNIVGEEYVRTISNSFIALGLISNWIPEKHTTRTFEIPACGTLLLTPSNDETTSFYSDQEVLFYNFENEIVERIKEVLKDKDKLEKLIINAFDKLIMGSYSYQKQFEQILKSIHLK